jgi:hypothetical protein
MEAGRRLAGPAFRDRLALGRREDQSQPIGEDDCPPLARSDDRREQDGFVKCLFATARDMGKIADVIRFLIFLFLGHGIMLELGDKGIHPDRFIADLIDAAISPNMSYSINLIIVCIFALIMTVIWESTNISQRFAHLWDVLTGRAAPEHATPAETAIGRSDSAEISTSHQESLISARQGLLSSPERFARQDIHYHHDTTTPGLGYRHKLWIVLRNQGSGELIVNPASWETSVGDIAVLPLAKHPWTPEGPGGWENNNWSWPRHERELEPIHVPRGGVIQTYVPLPGPLNDIELRRRIVSKRLGTLIIPFSMSGQQLSETKKL